MKFVLVTPGKSDVVAKETGIVFAERIFYELFYLAPKFTELSPQWSAALNEKRNSDKNQIPVPYQRKLLLKHHQCHSVRWQYDQSVPENHSHNQQGLIFPGRIRCPL